MRQPSTRRSGVREHAALRTHLMTCTLRQFPQADNVLRQVAQDYAEGKAVTPAPEADSNS
jgi:hypothetical protein